MLSVVKLLSAMTNFIIFRVIVCQCKVMTPFIVIIRITTIGATALSIMVLRITTPNTMVQSCYAGCHYSASHTQLCLASSYSVFLHKMSQY
jgi:hypothetical protein